MALQAGVVGPTRTDVSQAGVAGLSQGLQNLGNIGMANKNLNEQKRQFNMETFQNTTLKDIDLANLLTTPEGMNVAKPFIGQLTGMRGPALDQYMNNLVLAPQSPEAAIERTKILKMMDMVKQQEIAGGMPSQISLLEKAALDYLGKTQPREGVSEVPGSTPESAPGSAPAQPTKSVSGANLAQPASGQVTGAGYKAVFSPVAGGYVLLDEQNRRVQPNQITAGFKTADEALKNLDDALRTNTLQRLDDKVFDISQAQSVVEHPATAVMGMDETQLRAVIADPQADGRVKDAAQARLAGTTTQAAAPRTIVTGEKPVAQGAPSQAGAGPASFREFLWQKQQRGDQMPAGYRPVTSPTGSEITGAGNEALYNEYLAAKGGAPTTAKSPSQAAASVGQQALNKDDELLARMHLTRNDPEKLRALGLEPVTPQEEKRAEAILVKRQTALQGESRRQWVSNSELRGVFAKVADQAAFQLQEAAPGARPEDNPYLSALYTNWDGLKARQAEADIRKANAEAGMKEVESQYYVQKLKVDAAKTQIDYLLRQDEFMKAATDNAVDLLKTSHADAFKKAATLDPAAREKFIANLVDSDPIFKSLWNTITNGLTYASGQKLSEDQLKAARGGLFGIFQETTRVGVPTVESAGAGMGPISGDQGYAAEIAAAGF